MREPYGKGVASHPGPESCMGSREAAHEALTGEHAGRKLSCETIATRVLTYLHHAEDNTYEHAIASTRRALRSRRTQACMETPHARTGRPR